MCVSVSDAIDFYMHLCLKQNIISISINDTYKHLTSDKIIGSFATIINSTNFTLDCHLGEKLTVTIDAVYNLS